MKDDQRKGEELRSDDGDDDGLSFLLGLVFFSMVMVVVMVISLSSVWGLESVLLSFIPSIFSHHTRPNRASDHLLERKRGNRCKQFLEGKRGTGRKVTAQKKTKKREERRERVDRIRKASFSVEELFLLSLKAGSFSLHDA